MLQFLRKAIVVTADEVKLPWANNGPRWLFRKNLKKKHSFLDGRLMNGVGFVADISHEKNPPGYWM